MRALVPWWFVNVIATEVWKTHLPKMSAHLEQWVIEGGSVS